LERETRGETQRQRDKRQRVRLTSEKLTRLFTQVEQVLHHHDEEPRLVVGGQGPRHGPHGPAEAVERGPPRRPRRSGIGGSRR